jgi:predicted  nucleic acid-binding Zn-ribbon protein
MKQAQSQLSKAQNKIEQLNQEKLQLESQKLQMENKVEWYKAQTDRQYKEAMIDEAKRRTQVEILQLHDGNPYNDKLRQVDL